VGRARPAHSDLAFARRGIRGNEVACLVRPLAGQPGRCPGHHHPCPYPQRPRAPAAVLLRRSLYAFAFNPPCAAAMDPAAEAALAWAERASVPVARLADPAVLRAALDALTLRLDGRRAAASTIARKRAVFHNALGYAVETGLLDANPAGRVSWRPPQASGAVKPHVVASPGQVQALLTAVGHIRPELTAFFGCLYYAALRPEEAIALRQADCHLPATGWGKLTLTRTAPSTAAAWTGNGTSHEQRRLNSDPTRHPDRPRPARARHPAAPAP
jgi:integrase